MTRRGKVDRQFFEEHIGANLGAAREDVALGPTHGVDFGVIDVGERAMVLATDPISILPDLGFERAAEFALGIVLADVAVSGVAPTHLAVEFTLPPSMTDDEFAAVWDAFDRELTDLGTAVAAGHTARYDGCEYPWIGGATAMALADPEDVVRPDGARPGDTLLVASGPGVEAASMFASLFSKEIDVPDATLETAAERLPDLDHVRAAIAAAAAGPVTAMHDATEGGVHGALNEMATSADVRIDVDRGAFPIPDDIADVCEAVAMDPWRATSAGTLLVAVRPAGVGAVRRALESEGLPAAEVGAVRSGEGVYDAAGNRIEPPEGDSSWPVYARLASDDA